jgi:DNA-binding MarR family transcriptional regulator
MAKIKISDQTTQNNEIVKLDDETRNLFVLLELTRSTAVAALEIELKHYKTDFTEGRILFTLSRERNGMTQADISKYVLKKQNSISTQLTKMEKKGLIKKIKRPGDSKTYAALTAKGLELWNKINERSIYLTFSVLSKSEKDQLHHLLGKLRNQARNLLGLDFKPPFLP